MYTLEFSPELYRSTNIASTTKCVVNYINSFFRTDFNQAFDTAYYLQLYSGTKPINTNDILPYYNPNDKSNCLLRISVIPSAQFKRWFSTTDTSISRFYPGNPGQAATGSTVVNTGTATWFTLNAAFRNVANDNFYFDPEAYTPINAIVAVGSVGLIGSGEDLELPSVTFIQGQSYPHTPAIYIKSPPRVNTY